MAASEIRAVKGSGSAGSDLTITVDATGHGAGHHLIITIDHRNSASATVTGATDSKGNTYHLDDAIASTTNGLATLSGYLATALVSGDTIVITWNTPANSGTKAWKISEFSGLETTNWWDVTPTRGSVGSSATQTMPSITPSAGERLVIFNSGDQSSNAVSSIAGGWTQSGTRQSSSGPTNDVMIYKAATYNGSTAENSGTITYAGATSNGRQGSVVYKVAATSVPQHMRPERDASNSGGYTREGGGSTNLVGGINEATVDDATYVQSPGLSPGGAHKIWRHKLNAGNPPQTGTWTLKSRYREDVAGADTVNVKIRLYQGGGNTESAGSLITERTFSGIGAVVVEDDYPLSGSEKTAITDLGDLWGEMEAWAT